jgi:UDPglucose 6-dehydrogenase
VAKIAVIGTGYVGLSTGVCMVHLGHEVVCADVNAEKVELLKAGVVPIVEPRMEELLHEGLSSGHLQFVLGASKAVTEAEFIFLCLPTPQSESGEADLSFIVAAAKEISEHLLPNSVVINKSTVPVGSTQLVAQVLCRSDISVVSNPEFLREGTAVGDFLNPDRIVIGGDNQTDVTRVSELYDGIDAPVITTDPASAEMIKYASNAFLATKLSFVNAIATICEMVGADINKVTLGVGHDRRIGHDFLRPGPGWGGSCFPKDSAALLHLANSHGYKFDLMRSVIDENDQQFDRVAEKILSSTKFVRRVGVWGLTFKALTDDLRDSPSLEIIKRLVRKGVHVVAYDPTVGIQRESKFEFELADSPELATKDADVLAVLTEWPDFTKVDPVQVRKLMHGQVVIDARNLLDGDKWTSMGFDYFGLGRR